MEAFFSAQWVVTETPSSQKAGCGVYGIHESWFADVTRTLRWAGLTWNQPVNWLQNTSRCKCVCASMYVDMFRCKWPGERAIFPGLGFLVHPTKQRISSWFHLYHPHRWDLRFLNAAADFFSVCNGVSITSALPFLRQPPPQKNPEALPEAVNVLKWLSAGAVSGPLHDC